VNVNKIAAGALTGCLSIEDVDSVFEMFNITDLVSKIDHITAAMGNVVIFMVPGDGTDESKYDTLLAMFLTERQKSEEQQYK